MVESGRLVDTGGGVAVAEVVVGVGGMAGRAAREDMRGWQGWGGRGALGGGASMMPWSGLIWACLVGENMGSGVAGRVGVVGTRVLERGGGGIGGESLDGGLRGYGDGAPNILVVIVQGSGEVVSSHWVGVGGDGWGDTLKGTWVGKHGPIGLSTGGRAMGNDEFVSVLVCDLLGCLSGARLVYGLYRLLYLLYSSDSHKTLSMRGPGGNLRLVQTSLIGVRQWVHLSGSWVVEGQAGESYVSHGAVFGTYFTFNWMVALSIAWLHMHDLLTFSCAAAGVRW
ncbi:hypothetical protein Tco_1173878 [Tanacetum coccineum]